MFHFTLFGIPINVQPMFWLSMAVFGYLIANQSANSEQELLFKILLFLLIAFVSLIVHELGHALTGRKLSKSEPKIELVAFAGYAEFPPYTKFSKWGHRLMIAAGPATNLALFGIGLGAMDLMEQYAPERVDSLFFWFLNLATWINLVWFIFNILPVYPLDGGQLMHSMIKSPKIAHIVSLIICAFLILICIKYGMIIAILFFIMMAYQNFQMLQLYKNR